MTERARRAVVASAVVFAAALVVYAWIGSLPVSVVLVHEFERGFSGRFVVVDSGADLPAPEGGELVIRIPQSGVARVPLSRVRIRDRSARYVDGEKLPTKTFLYHHVPRDAIVAWSYGVRQLDDHPWEWGGFVGLWADAERDYHAWNARQ
jgi:hypothetical protein